jgi:hypothetical protein
MILDTKFKEAWFKNINYEPHSKGQWDLHRSDARFRVCVCGRRWGKSFSVSQEATAYLCVPDTSVAVIAPTYKHSDIVYREIYRRIVRDGAIPTRRVSQYEIETAWGSRVVKRSADKPDNILGDGHDLVIVDEFSVLKEEVWTQYIRPTLSDRRGAALFIGTPRGFNYAYQLYQLGLDPDSPEWACFRNPTWTSPRISPDEVEQAKNDLPELMFQQEYGAEFVAVGGMVYPFRPDYHLNKKFYAPQRYSRIVGGVDWGFANPSAVILGGVINEHPLVVHVFHEWTLPRQTTPEVVNKLKDLQDEFAVLGFFIDPSAADLIEQAENAGVRVEPANNDVPGGIAAVASMMEGDPSRLTFAPGMVQTIHEITRYRYEDTFNRNINEKPAKKDDHCMDALRYMVMGVRDSYQPWDATLAGEREDLKWMP